MKRSVRRRWIGLLSLGLIAVAAIVVVLLAPWQSYSTGTVFAGTNDDRFTATAYSDVVRFQADGVATLQVRIFDLSGKEVWDSGMVSGNIVDWDRRNDTGERLAYGAYIYSAQGWNASGDSIFQKNGKLALMPGDKVQLQAAPVASSPTQDAEWREEPVLSPMTEPLMTQTINDSLTVRETSGNTYLTIDTPGSGLQSVLYWKENGVGRASMFFDPPNNVLKLKTYGADSIAFLTNGNNERMRITAAGRVQVNSSNSNAYLDVNAGDGKEAVLYWKEGGVGRASMFFDPAGSELNFKTYGADHITFVTAGIDRMTVRNTGNVGIGTTNATDKLTIQGSSGNLIACYPGASRAAGAAVFRVEADGDVYADGNYYCGAGAPGCYQSGNADVAERINTSEWVKKGNVVEIDPEHPGFFRRTRSPYSTNVAGVISTSPGVVLGNNFDAKADKWEDNRPMLALAGRVPVKASTENGPIQIGDLLVSSSVPGVAMKGDPAAAIGAVVGKAMEPLENGSGTIMVQVMLR